MKQHDGGPSPHNAVMYGETVYADIMLTNQIISINISAIFPIIHTTIAPVFR